MCSERLRLAARNGRLSENPVFFLNPFGKVRFFKDLTTTPLSGGGAAPGSIGGPLGALWLRLLAQPRYSAGTEDASRTLFLSYLTSTTSVKQGPGGSWAPAVPPARGRSGPQGGLKTQNPNAAGFGLFIPRFLPLAATPRTPRLL